MGLRADEAQMRKFQSLRQQFTKSMIESATSSAAASEACSSPETNMKGSDSDTSVHLENLPAAARNKDVVDDSPDNPRNWPKWKKNAQIIMIAFHSMMGTFMAAGVVPAYEAFAEEYKVTVQQASYFTSIQVSIDGYSKFHILNLTIVIPDPADGSLPPRMEAHHLHLRPLPSVPNIRLGELCV